MLQSVVSIVRSKEIKKSVFEARGVTKVYRMGEVEVHERDTGGRRAKVVRRIQAAGTTAGAAA